MTAIEEAEDALVSTAAVKEIKDFLDPETVECPFDYYAWARAEAPVYRLPNSPVPGIDDVYLVTPYALVDEVVRDWKRFSNKFGSILGRSGVIDEEMKAIQAQGYGDTPTMLTQDPPAQRHYRALVNKAFSARRVKSMEDYIRQICTELIDGFIDDGECDFFEAFAVPLPVYVIADQLGVKREDLPKFQKWSDDVIANLGHMQGREAQLEAARSVVALQHYFADIVEQRRAAPKDDVISVIANGLYDDERLLTMSECLSIIQQLLVAGNETTRNALAAGIVYVVEQPGMAQGFAADPSLIPNAVEEIVRLEAPTKHMWRIVNEDTTLGGFALSKGDVLLLSYDSANHDERKFPDPETCAFARDNAGDHLSFGFGIHFCVGAALARAEMAIGFEESFTRLKNIRLTEGKNDLRHIVSMMHRGYQRLHISFDKA